MRPNLIRWFPAAERTNVYGFCRRKFLAPEERNVTLSEEYLAPTELQSGLGGSFYKYQALRD